jgi:hypothetical protein
MMDSNDARCAEHRKFKMIDAAFRLGDLAALRAAVVDPADIQNGTRVAGRAGSSLGRCLTTCLLLSRACCADSQNNSTPLHFIRADNID